MDCTTEADTPPLIRPGRRPWLAFGEFSLLSLFDAFALIVIVAIVAIFVSSSAKEYRHETDVARRAAANLAESLAEQGNETFAAADGALRALGVHGQTGKIGPAARERIRDRALALVAAMPRIHHLVVLDARGEYFVGDYSGVGRHMPSAADRPYFQFHRAHPSRDVHISGPAISKAARAWVVFATRRFNDARGRFAGVTVAPISLEYFERSYARVDIGRAGSITLFGDDGRIIARQPEVSIGDVIRDAPQASAVGDVRPSRFDGTTSLFASRRLGRYPLTVQVALAQSEYLADWRTTTLINGAVRLVLLAMIGVLAIGLRAQISRRKLAEETLTRLALIDGLTGLANRRQFDAALDRSWRDGVRTRAPLALLMIDVDFFKAYNDEYGHQQGDRALIAIAQAIAAASVRPGDLAARYGGEEFVVLLPATTAPSAATVAERIRRAVWALDVRHAGSASGKVTVSIGVAGTIPARFGDSSVLVAAADRVLYAAKRAGRDRTVTLPEINASVSSPTRVSDP